MNTYSEHNFRVPCFPNTLTHDLWDVDSPFCEYNFPVPSVPKVKDKIYLRCEHLLLQNVYTYVHISEIPLYVYCTKLTFIFVCTFKHKSTPYQLAITHLYNVGEGGKWSHIQCYCEIYMINVFIIKYKLVFVYIYVESPVNYPNRGRVESHTLTC